jgi:hypothetical protein
MKTKVLYILLFGWFASGLRAQDTAFWFVAPHMSELVAGAHSLNRPAFLAISNGTYQEAHIELTLYNGGNTLTIPATIAPGGLYKHDFNLPPNTATNTDIKCIENPRDSAGLVTMRGLYVHSKDGVRVTAYYMLNHTESRDIFTLKGQKALGTQFYVPMQSDNASKSNGGPNANWQGYDQVDIVATEDDTEVTIVPKANIRIGTSGSSARGVTIHRTLKKGQTLKIMENTQDEDPSLAGTPISSNKPIAVTVTEDLVRGDTSGDQAVPVNSLGTHYIVPRGYLTPANWERFYLVATAATTVKVYYDPADASKYDLIPLNAAGNVERYTFPSNTDAVYLESSTPVYVYQRSGYGEEGAAVLPSVYAIGQNRLSYFQVGNSVITRKGFLVFRSETESYFKITYGSVNNAPLSVGAPYPVPNVSEWKVARFDLSPGADNQVVTIQNDRSPFSFGYIAGGGGTSYGYFSAFGTFAFPDTTWMCGTSVALLGGYSNASELQGTAYQWQISLDNVNWTDIGGATSSAYSPVASTQTLTWYRRGMTSDFCAMAYTYGVKVRLSSCTLPVNPHLMGRFRGD